MTRNVIFARGRAIRLLANYAVGELLFPGTSVDLAVALVVFGVWPKDATFP
jgi:hypothetical protein